MQREIHLSRESHEFDCAHRDECSLEILRYFVKIVEIIFCYWLNNLTVQYVIKTEIFLQNISVIAVLIAIC